jgi:8-oxo-dGTP diphosphatase
MLAGHSHVTSHSWIEVGDEDLRQFVGKTTTAIIIYPDDRILLVKRSTPPFIGYWALPGGRIEPGEEADKAIVREVKEETGLDIEILKKIGDYHEKGLQDGIEYDYFPTCFLVRVIGGAIRRQKSEIEEVKSFKTTQIPKSLAFEHDQMIRDYFRSSKI